MIVKKRFVLIAILILVLSFTGKLYAYEDEFHILITREAIKHADNLYNEEDDYLMTELGFSKGLDTEFTGPDKKETTGIPCISTYTAKEWIKRGSVIEDSPLGIRARTHFYDPINERGLTDLRGGRTNDNALTRARGDGEIEFHYSWRNARDYYYLALTSERESIPRENERTSPHSRNWYFAQMFRALGQVLHLLEDMAVPAHVRNDCHAPIIDKKDPYEGYWTTEKGLPSIFDYPVAFNEFDHFWDKDDLSGLAEFTNRNFLSRDTIFKGSRDELHYYPNPAEGDCRVREVYDEGDDTWRHYWSYPEAYDGYTRETFTVNRLVQVSYIGLNRDGTPWYEVGDLVDFPADYCHKEYGQKIIPRAIGYSAGLLNYFFRKELNVRTEVNPAEGIEFYVSCEGIDVDDLYNNIEVYTDVVPRYTDRPRRRRVEGSEMEIIDSEVRIKIPPIWHYYSVRSILVYRGPVEEDEGGEEIVIGKVLNIAVNKFFDIDYDEELLVGKTFHRRLRGSAEMGYSSPEDIDTVMSIVKNMAYVDFINNAATGGEWVEDIGGGDDVNIGLRVNTGGSISESPHLIGAHQTSWRGYAKLNLDYFENKTIDNLFLVAPFHFGVWNDGILICKDSSNSWPVNWGGGDVLLYRIHPDDPDTYPSGSDTLDYIKIVEMDLELFNLSGLNTFEIYCEIDMDNNFETGVHHRYYPGTLYEIIFYSEAEDD